MKPFLKYLEESEKYSYGARNDDIASLTQVIHTTQQDERVPGGVRHAFVMVPSSAQFPAIENKYDANREIMRALEHNKKMGHTLVGVYSQGHPIWDQYVGRFMGVKNRETMANPSPDKKSK